MNKKNTEKTNRRVKRFMNFDNGYSLGKYMTRGGNGGIFFIN